MKNIKNHRKKRCAFIIIRKEYWALLSKSPKRPIETIYLKEGEREKNCE